MLAHESKWRLVLKNELVSKIIHLQPEPFVSHRAQHTHVLLAHVFLIFFFFFGHRALNTHIYSGRFAIILTSLLSLRGEKRLGANLDGKTFVHSL